MNFKESEKLFNKAISTLDSQDILDSYEQVCDCLISRILSSAPSLDFYLFFRTQLLNYLKEKRSLSLSIAEADMISDLIYSSYEDFLESIKDNPFVKSAKGRFRLLMSVKIVFPVQNDTVLDDFSKLVSN